MKKLSEMKIAKDAILSPLEADAKGGNAWGSNTSYAGPTAPTTLLTDWGQGPPYDPDPYSGRMLGDWWNIDASMSNFATGLLSIKPV